MIAALLSRLDRVRRTSGETWIACCPSHDDKQPSLTLRELDDGRILLHCFAGCDTVSVLGAIGMGLDDLFPGPLGDCLVPQKHKFPARDVLECVAKEALVVRICAAGMAKGTGLSDEDTKRLAVATQRLTEAIDVIRG